MQSELHSTTHTALFRIGAEELSVSGWPSDEVLDACNTYHRQIRPHGKRKMAQRIPQMPYFFVASWLPAAHWFMTAVEMPLSVQDRFKVVQGGDGTRQPREIGTRCRTDHSRFSWYAFPSILEIHSVQRRVKQGTSESCTREESSRTDSQEGKGWKYVKDSWELEWGAPSQLASLLYSSIGGTFLVS